MAPRGNARGSFDVTAFEATFTSATDLLVKMMKFSPIPSTEIVPGTESLNDNAVTFLPRGYASASESGVKTSDVDAKLKGLHEKLNLLKGKKKVEYKERVMKNGLQRKIAKKEKKKLYAQAKKLKTIKSQEAGSIFIPKTDVDKKDIKLMPTKPSKPVYNSEGKMVFSKFDFDESKQMSTDMRGKKFYDPKALLQKLQKDNESMKNLEMTGDLERIKAVKEEQVWNKALQMADGVKIKDDPVRLAKAAKKIKQRKAKHQTQWEVRKEAVDKKMSLKAQKRQTNISDRQKKVKNNKMRKSAKRGRVIPGF